MYFNNADWILSYLFPGLEWAVKTKEKEIFLTFDDGPIPEVTDFVLDTLDSFHAKATFFCVGENIKKHPDIYQKILSKGHRTGNHTFNHYNGWKTEDQSYFRNVDLCQKQMGVINHEGVKLFRPPYGKIKRSQIKVLRDKYRIVMWSVLTGDFDGNLAPEKCLEKAVKYTKSGSIVIFHDSIKAEKNLRYALPKYLQYFAERGFIFKEL